MAKSERKSHRIQIVSYPQRVHWSVWSLVKTRDDVSTPWVVLHGVTTAATEKRSLYRVREARAAKLTDVTTLSVAFAVSVDAAGAANVVAHSSTC